MIAVREINDLSELAELGPTWSELLERTPGASFVHSPLWLKLYWKHFGAGKRLRILVVEDGERLIGIQPLVVRTFGRWEPFRALTYPLDDWGNYYGPVGPDPLTTLSAGLDHIRRTPRDWHFIDFPWVDEYLDEGRTKSALERAGFAAVCEKSVVSSIIDLTAFGSWENFCASHNSKWRNTLGRQEKKLARRGTVSYLRDRREGLQAEQAPRWDLYDHCEMISEASWQGSARTGTMLNKAPYRSFFRDCFEHATGEFGVDLDLLYVDGQPAAFGYSYCYRGRVIVMKVAYHPDFGFEGAGTVLQARMLAESFARGDHTIEMGHEFMYWKRNWVTHVRPVHRYVHFPATSVMAQLVRGKRALVRRLRRSRDVEPATVAASDG